MSVINKMLRDLDQQAVSGAAATPSRAAPVEIMRGTVSVPGQGAAALPPAPRNRLVLVAILLLVTSSVLTTVWFWPRASVLPPLAPVAAVLVPAAPAAVSAQVAVAPPAAVVESPPPVATPPAASAVAAVEPSRQAAALAPAVPAVRSPATTGAVVAAAPPTVLPSIAKAAASPAAPPVRVEVAAVPTPRAASTVVEPRASAVTWQEAAQETLGQAQRQWAGGSRESAADILREALAVVERSHSAEISGAGANVVLAMLRELVRMDMAMGQDAPVLALLKRFERVATGQPDLWALRGNAAQRLGQHPEAVLAYLNALRLRAGEPRWMLGAAVSLAAQGQAAAAAEYAEQARTLTTVSPDVLAYLRQAGVPLR